MDKLCMCVLVFELRSVFYRIVLNVPQVLRVQGFFFFPLSLPFGADLVYLHISYLSRIYSHIGMQVTFFLNYKIM